MSHDQRLRLLAASPNDKRATAALTALDDVHVVIDPGAEMASVHVPALIALAALLARLVGRVSIARPVAAPPNWWGVGSVGEIVDVVEGLRAALPARLPSRTLRVTFGAEGVAPADLGVGGGDLIAGVGLSPVVLDPAVHALGVHAAACLAVGQVLNRVLGGLGYPGVVLDEPYALDLITHRPIHGARAEAPRLSSPSPPARPLDIAVAGVGSVGTSTLALLAMSVGGRRGGRPAPAELHVTAIDGDRLDPRRNPFRYPALRGGEQGNKADWIVGRLREFGIAADAASCGVGKWAMTRPQPGFDGLLVSSVDTVPARLDVADVLARETLSVGVSGLALHAQRERFADGLCCPFCDYVSADPPATQAQVYATLTGLSVARVLQLLDGDASLTAADLEAVAATGRVPDHRRAELVGFRLADLVREAYAEAPLRTGAPDSGTVAVAAPHVSWFAGVLAAVEVLKQLEGLPLLDRRVDVDLGGLPPGVVRRVPADRTGHCVCRSAVRRRWVERMYRVRLDRG
ncbi:hypothetical protein ACVGOW_12910 [Pseudonocardia saturnea]